MIREILLKDLSLWGCVWQSVSFAVIGLIGSFLLRRRPARASQVLFLAMIAAVLVPAMGVLVKHFEMGVFVSEPVVLEPEEPSEAAATDYAVYARVPSTSIRQEPHMAAGEPASVPLDSEGVKIAWRMIVLYGWMVVTLTLLGRLFVALVGGVSLLRRAQSCGCKQIQQAADSARAGLGITRGLQVRSSEDVHSPVIWCWSPTPVLVVPNDLDHRTAWVGVISHELAHWKRWDHISGLIAELAACILPWNPLLWWSKKRMVRFSEQACDDWVIAAGQPREDYAQSLLNFQPQNQAALVLAVVHSRKGLTDRVRRILNDRSSNPRAGTLWVLAVSAAALCLAAGVALAQTKPGGAEDRIVHFPTDRSVGQLSIQDAGAARELTYWFHWTGPRPEYFCEAQGDVHVPAGKQLYLNVNRTASGDLSWLSKLGPDDLYGFGITVLLTDPAKPSDECMAHIAHLTGLKSLSLDRTNVTDRGFEYIRNLKSLEYLHMPMQVTDKGMAYVAQLCSLKGLYFGQMGSQVSDAGLRHLAKLNSLQELALWGERMGDAGLAHLRGLPQLEYLFLYGTHFTDKGCVHLKEIPSLKILSFYEGLCRITDAGLADVSKIATLESLSLNVTGPITDDGIAHLSKMRSLKKLDIANSQITDRGLGYLSQIKMLETLNLPQRDQHITDVGLAHLGQLPNLKSLSVTETHYAIPTMNPDWYTDKGLAELAKCHLLEELNIGSIGVTDAGMEDIAKMTNLKSLLLFGCGSVTDSGIVKLTALKSLTNLHISHADVSIAGLNDLKSMPNLTKLDVFPIKRNGATLDISGLATLEELGLSFARYSQDNFVDADLKCLTELKRLRWLQIGPRDYTDKGMAYLAQLPNMERLGIGGSVLTDEGLQHLSNMKKLNHLSIVRGFDANKGGYISGGSITDRGLRELEGLKLLSFLDIYSDDTFSDAALTRLQEELPNLSHLSINGGMLTRINSEDKSEPSSRAAPVRQTRVGMGKRR